MLYVFNSLWDWGAFLDWFASICSSLHMSACQSIVWKIASVWLYAGIIKDSNAVYQQI